MNINALYDDRANPDSRAVLEDYQIENGARDTRLGLALWFIHAADAADAADAAADAAANAAYAAAYAADAAAAHDKSLADFAECVVQILIEMKAPGCQWLDLTDAVSVPAAER